MLRAILALRCPRCRRGPLFTGVITMPERCASCGMYYEREHGYFVGAMAISYGLAVTLIAVVFGALLWLTKWPVERILLVSGAAFLPLAPVCFRYSRAIWIYLDRRIDPLDRKDR